MYLRRHTIPILPGSSICAYIAAMPARKPRPSDGKTQSERFIEMARELGCSEDEAEFRREKLGQIPGGTSRRAKPLKSIRRMTSTGWAVIVVGSLATMAIINAVRQVYLEVARAVTLLRLIDTTQRDILSFLQNSGLNSPDRNLRPEI